MQELVGQCVGNCDGCQSAWGHALTPFLSSSLMCVSESGSHYTAQAGLGLTRQNVAQGRSLPQPEYCITDTNTALSCQPASVPVPVTYLDPLS